MTIFLTRQDDGLRVGLHALGIGTGSRPEIIAAVAGQADELGFATLWCGEHVVMVDVPASRYPYSSDGRIAVPSDADWLDPMLALTYAAAHTRSITLATGILLLPEHNPLIVAKQAATIDVLSGGRFALGVGTGWSAEEFAALGVPFARRGARTSEYVQAIREAWKQDVATFHGEFTTFDSVRINPRPVRGRRLPVIVGGTTDAALNRVAAVGDGWYGFSLTVDQVRSRLDVLAAACRERGRDVGDLYLAVSLADPDPAALPELCAAGVNEAVVVAAPPDRPEDARQWVSELARTWVAAGRQA